MDPLERRPARSPLGSARTSAGADPPFSSAELLNLYRSTCMAISLAGTAPWDWPLAAPLLRPLLRDARQQCADFCLPVPAVPAQGADGGQFPGFRPAGDRLRVDPE